MNEIQKEQEVINILITDDHMMVRDGLKIMLASLHKLIPCKVLEAESGEDALRKIGRNRVELVIMDYQMPGLSGAETIYRILRYQPEMKILALSNYDELPVIQSMLEAGAKGYVLKNIEPAEMLSAIKTILAGRAYHCNEVSIKLIEAGEHKNDTAKSRSRILTPRETEVLRLIAMEMTNEEIARKLFVSRRTIDTHRQNLINKLHVKNTVGLLKAALKFNLVDPM